MGKYASHIQSKTILLGRIVYFAFSLLSWLLYCCLLFLNCATPLLQLVQLDHLIQTILDIHVFKSIKNTTLATVRKRHTRVDRPSCDGFL
mmetsp:Transcript_15416/g.26131  ORF Transcript_15416/g.26131 Transcript_15416/m.26131 type:complete len:90 (-) Transcript_15416:502-771(-)